MHYVDKVWAKIGVPLLDIDRQRKGFLRFQTSVPNFIKVGFTRLKLRPWERGQTDRQTEMTWVIL